MPVRELELRHHDGLGLVLGPDDLDHPVQVQEGNDIAFQQFHPRIDLVEPVLGTADKHLDLVLQPFGEQFLQAHDARRVMRIKHIEVQRYAVFKVGEPEQTGSEEHTSELQSLMRISYAVSCLKKHNK